jgi:hypothetical protein
MNLLRIVIREQNNGKAITTLAEEDYEEFESFFTDAHQILDDLEQMRAKQYAANINPSVPRGEEES